MKLYFGNMVLCDVQWSNAESCGYGVCENYTVHLGDFCFKGIGDDSAVEIGYFSYGEGISAILDGIC